MALDRRTWKTGPPQVCLKEARLQGQLVWRPGERKAGIVDAHRGDQARCELNGGQVGKADVGKHWGL
jgi:hypothetical protein